MIEFAKRESTRAITEKKNEIEARLAETRLEEERLSRASENMDRPRKKQVCDSPVPALKDSAPTTRYRNLVRKKKSRTPRVMISLSLMNMKARLRSGRLPRRGQNRAITCLPVLWRCWSVSRVKFPFSQKIRTVKTRRSRSSSALGHIPSYHSL